jgi:hypothetical protein
LFIKQRKRIYNYIFNIYDKYIKVDVYSYNKKNQNNKPLFSFEDHIENTNDLYTFKRIINNEEYHFINGEMVYKSVSRKVKYLKKVGISLYRTEKFITMDLETRTIDGKMEPICLSIYNGKYKASFFINDYKNPDDMIKTGIRSIMKRQFYGYRVFFHNFSYFDGIFIMRILSEMGEIKRPIIRDNRLIQIPFNFGKGAVLYFEDSYLLLTASLDKLGKSFNVENKGIFPILFVNNSKIDLNYIGEVPNYEYFIKLNYSDYINYKSKYTKNS